VLKQQGLVLHDCADAVRHLGKARVGEARVGRGGEGGVGKDRMEKARVGRKEGML
jgi:hypothetical protein